ncbi:B12-binding domain-containing radical SAM protein [Myxococcota bacterium]|nr:B12-binding domain-containing radical SAM protein [Myxococcota bacterium]
MKVLLVQPPIERMLDTLLPRFVEEEAGFYPPLGLLYAAAGLERRPPPGLELAAIDAVARGLDHPRLLREVARRAPDVVGITATTFTLPDAVALARGIKSLDPAVHVVMGGPHCGLYPRETASLPHVDSVVAGEAEETFPDLVAALAAGREPAGIPGTAVRGRDGEVVVGPPRPVPDRLDDLPLPARHLLPASDYFAVHGRHPAMTTMLTSRGCPYDCSFCYHSMGRKFRARSPSGVVDEMEAIAASGVREVFVFDDTFTVNRKRVAAICDEIVARGLALRVSWDVRARVDGVDGPLLEKLRRAGCDRISFGVESGTDEVLAALKKRIDLGAASRVVRDAKSLGFTTYADFIIGNPGETREQVRRTVDYACTLPLDFAQFALLTPYPETELYREGRQRGILPRGDYWRAFARAPEAPFTPPLWEEHMGRDELFAALGDAYRRFYLRPRFVLRRLKGARSPGDLVRDARAALKLALAGPPGPPSPGPDPR